MVKIAPLHFNIYNMNETKCPYCGKDKKPNNKFCSMTCRNKNSKGNRKPMTDAKKLHLSNIVSQRYLKTNGHLKDFTVKCNKCDKEIIVNEPEYKFPTKEKYFCSTLCSKSRDVSYTQTEDFRKNISSIIKNMWLTDEEFKRKSLLVLQKKQFNSKGERLVRKHFQEKYINDEWISGGALNYKGTVLCRDMYSKKLKICFEYDGIWHFKDIKGQLETKQYKDKLLEEWCLENDYRLIRIRDEIFLTDTQKYLLEIEKSIYHSTEPIIKIYNSI